MSPHKIWNIRIFFLATALLGSVLLFSLERSSAVFAQSEAVFIRQIRAFDRDNVGDLDPVGLAFSPEAETFLVVEAGTITHSSRVITNVTMITALEERIGSVPIEANIFDEINVAFDSRFGRLLLIDSANNELIEIKAGPDGTVDSSTLIRHDARHFGIAIAQGMTVDPASGHLFIVDSSGPQIVRVEPGLDGGFDQAAVSIMDLKSTGLEEVRGIAFDPDSGHLHLYSPRDQELVELTQSGQFVAGRDMSGFDLQMPQAMVFAPSGDQTDDPAKMSLYLADSGSVVQTQAANSGKSGQTNPAGFQTYMPLVMNNSSGDSDNGGEQEPGTIIELSFVKPPAPVGFRLLASGPVNLVQTINAWQWTPPSPDSAGIVYLPNSNHLLVSDSEVNEMSIFTGDNLFEATLAGVLADSLTTVPFSDEPTGMTFNPSNGHLFISDDTGTRAIYEMNPGPDGLYDTIDDTITTFGTSAFGSSDPEGVTYASALGALFIADGVNSEIYKVTPGANGLFDGEAPAGDDVVTSFDTAGMGLSDPEGIAYNSDNGNLYSVGKPSTLLFEITTEGALVQTIDISAANARKPAGLAYAPSSQNPNQMNIYIADRGTDNGSNPNENDGLIYEMALPVSVPVPPVANYDSASTTEGIAVSVDVAADDTDPNGNLNPNSANSSCANGSIGCEGAANGSLNDNGDGTITYTPDAGYYGTDSFIYEICDTDLLCSVATVEITVTENLPPTANDDSAATTVDTLVTIDVAANDVDTNSNLDPTSANNICTPTCSAPTNGVLSNNGDGSFSYTPGTGYLGSDSFVYEICDTNGVCDTAEVAISVIVATDFIDVSVAASSDDAEEDDAGGVSLTSSDLEMVLEGTLQTVGMRFNGINIPAGSNILNATIQFQADEVNLEATDLTIQGEDSDNAVTFTSANANISSRPRTSAAISWSPAPWPTKGEAGPDQQTSNIAAVIQDIVARPGWTSGNSLAIIVSGSGKRVAEAYDGTAAPLLHIEYSSSGNQRPAVSINAPANGSTFFQGDTVTFGGTASDFEDGDLTASLTWASDVDGAIGSGGSFSNADLSLGSHTVTATATDSNGQDAFDSLAINILSPGSAVFAGAGDIAQCGIDEDEETAKLLDNIPGTVYTVGDNAYPNGTDAEFNNCYEPTWGRHKARTYPAVGDNEYNSSAVAAGHFNYYGAAAGNQNEGYYSYDVGSWHIIVLNSNCSKIGGCGPNDPQGQWLQADLAANPRACTLAIHHEPLFSSNGGDIDLRDFWVPLYAAGTDIVLSGHRHNYERFAQQNPDGTADPGRGIRQFVVGTGGSNLSSFGVISPNSEARNDNTHGVLKLTLHPTSYDWEFIPIAGQTFTDSGSANCVLPAGTGSLPTAVDDAATTPEDTPVTIDVAANDTDPDGNLNAASANTDCLTCGLPANGSLSNNGNGTFDYTPALNFNGSDSFIYEVCDDLNGCDTATANITITPENDPPVANDDSASTAMNTAVTIDVAANDTDVDGDLNAASANTDCPTPTCALPANGSLANNGDGTFTYTPDTGFTGSDSFSYEICDTGPMCVKAVATITVTIATNPPQATNDDATTPEDTPVTIDVAANDTDPDGNLNAASANTDCLTCGLPANGSLSNNGNGTFDYTPALNFNGSDSFIYEVCDDLNECDTATANITITPENDPPVANDDSASTAMNTAVMIDVAANDTDVDGDLDAASANTDCPTPTCELPANGSLANNGDGTFTYTPSGGFTGSDSFSYEICDTGLLCDTASVTISIISATNSIDVSVAASSDDAEEDDTGGVSLTSSDLEMVMEGTLQTVGMRFNGINIPPGSTIVNATIQFQADEVNLEATDLTIQGEDNDNAATFTAAGGNISSRPRTSAAISWSPAPWPTKGDAGPDQQTSNIGPVIQEIVSRPGWTSGNSLAIIVSGSGKRVAEAYDGTAAPLLHVEYTISPPDFEIPTAADDASTTTEDKAVNIAVVNNDDFGRDGPSTSPITVLNQPSNGTAAVNESGTANDPTDDSIDYTPVLNFNGSDSFTYEICDVTGDCDTATANITITPENDPPVANDDSASTAMNTAVTIDVAANDTDVDGDLDASSANTDCPNPTCAVPANGSLANNGDGTFTYTPSGGFTGSDSFSYEICDTGLLCDTATVSITVVGQQSIGTIYVSSSGSVTIGANRFKDEDILAYDNNTGTWSIFFDGSLVGLDASGMDVNAFHINGDGSILLSFDKFVTIPGVGAVEDADIVRFIPTSPGDNSSGTFEWYFDGSDVGLLGKDIDAIGFAPDGRLAISLSGSFSVPGVSGADEDVILFTATNLGEITSGSWEAYFDGSLVELTLSTEDIGGTWIANNGDLYLSFRGAFAVTGAAGDGADIVSCVSGGTGPSTSCTYSLFWDGSTDGLAGETIDGFFLAP